MSNNQKVFTKKNLNLQPILNNVEIVNNEKIYDYTFFVGIDSTNYKKYKINTIDIELTSNFSLKELKNNTSDNTFFQKESKNSGSLISKILSGKSNKVKNIFSKKIQQNAISPIRKTSINELVANVNLTQPQKGIIIQRTGNGNNNNKDLIKQEKDINLFKNAQKSRKKGILLSPRIKLPNSISNVKEFKKQTIDVERNLISIPIKMRIKKSELTNLKYNGISFIANFAAKDHLDNIIDATHQVIKHNYLESFYNFDIENINDITLFANRNLIEIKSRNFTKNQNITMNIYVKKINPFSKNIPRYEKIASDIPLKDKSKILRINDNSKNSIKISDINNQYTTFYIRATFEINGMPINNYVEDSIPPIVYHDKNYVSFFVIQEKSNNKNYMNIIIDASFIEPDVSMIKVVKKEYVDGIPQTIEFLSARDEKNFEQFQSMSKIKNIKTFVDFNIKDDRTYEYKLELHYEGRKKIITGNSYFIESKFPEEIITYNTVETLSDQIKINFEYTDNNAEKVLKQLYGNLYNLFEEEIKNIKMLTSRFLSVRVEKIFINPEEVLNYGEYTPDENNNIIIPIKTKDNCIYKIIPMIKPAGSVFSELNKNLKNPKNIKQLKVSDPLSYVTLTNKTKESNNIIISSLNNKYATRSAIKKSVLGKENDNVFQDAETGDNIYITNYQNSTKDQETNIKNIQYSMLSNKKDINVSFQYDHNEYQEEIYLITINASISSMIDHFLITSYQNGEIKILSKGHVDNTKKIHNIVVKCPKGIGKKEIYCYLVDSNGIVSNKYIAENKNEQKRVFKY